MMMCGGGFIYLWTCFDGWMSWATGSRYTDFMIFGDSIIHPW
jgi:hypothetical protein